MEGSPKFKENPPPEYSPPLVFPSTDNDQLATNENLKVSQLSPTLTLVLTPDDEIVKIKDSEQNLETPVAPQDVSIENHKDENDSESLWSVVTEPPEVETKIVARLSPDDDYIPPVPSPKPSNGSLGKFTVNSPMYYIGSGKSNERSKRRSYSVDFTGGQIDTTAPFESVKAAVSKFGGIVDWKAHRMQTVERRKFIEQELETAKEEIPSYKQQAETAEKSKTQVLKELDSTKRLIEELKLNLERSQTEEQQAKQDSELAKLRIEEMEQGIAGDLSFAAKAQLEVAKARHTAAVSALKTVNSELEQLRKDYTLLVSEKDEVVKKAEEAVYISKEVEKSVEDLTIELINVKESLESARASHLEAEEQRIETIMAREQDTLTWEKELKIVEEELEKLNKKILSTKDLKLNLNKATELLQELKAELAAYMESSLEYSINDPEKKTRSDIEEAIFAAKNELEEIKLNIEKATEKVGMLRVAEKSLTSELETEKMELFAIKTREGMATIAASSLEDELERVKSELSISKMKAKEEKEKMVDLPKKLQEAAEEADQAKVLVEMARDKLRKVKEEAEYAKAGAVTVESRLHAAEKELEAAKASEKLALAAINALEENESAHKADSPVGVMLSLDEYYQLSKRVHEAEEQANAKVAAAISQIEVAKEFEFKSLKKLEEANHEMAGKKDQLNIATQKAEEAKEGKLGVEQELRKWRAEHKQKRKAVESVVLAAVNTSKTPKPNFDSSNYSENFVTMPESSNLHQRSPKSSYTSSASEFESSSEKNVTKKKKKSFFPRVFMFLARKKAQAHKLA